MITSRMRLANFRFYTIIGLLLLSLSFQAKAITLNFQGLNGTVINFDTNSTFGFTSTNGYQFSISSSDGVQDSVGLNGYVSPGGPFTIGTIQTFGPTETASVTGPEHPAYYRHQRARSDRFDRMGHDHDG